MAVFLITPLLNNFKELGAALAEKLPKEDFLPLQNDSGYLVSFRGTSVELSNIVGITSEDRTTKSSLGSAMVTAVGAYYGRGPTPMWEWLKSRFEAQ